MKALLAVSLALALGGCGTALFQPQDPSRGAEATTRPEARPAAGPSAAPPPPRTAATAEEFDTTTQAERVAAAAAPAAGGERRLGETVASLGDVTQPGFWLATPLVSEPGEGRVLNPATGQSSQVSLIPIAGPPTAGSRISLAAMRLIGAPLTELPTVEVFTGG